MNTITGNRNVPNEDTVRRIMKRFDQTGSVKDVKTETRLRLGRSTENISTVRVNVAESPTPAIRHRPYQICVFTNTIHRILTKDFQFHAYKVQLTQELIPEGHG